MQIHAQLGYSRLNGIFVIFASKSEKLADFLKLLSTLRSDVDMKHAHTHFEPDITCQNKLVEPEMLSKFRLSFQVIIEHRLPPGKTLKALTLRMTQEDKKRCRLAF